MCNFKNKINIRWIKRVGLFDKERSIKISTEIMHASCNRRSLNVTMPIEERTIIFYLREHVHTFILTDVTTKS